MKRVIESAVLLFCLASMVSLSTSLARAADADQFKVLRTMHIGGEGRWDYATIDEAGERLYLPRSNHTLVISAADGKVIADIKGGDRLHGVALAPAAHRGFITDGGKGEVLIFDLASFEVLGKIPAADDADGAIFDAGTGKVLVACGDAQSLVVIDPAVDPKQGKPEATIPLGGKPEFLAADGKGMAYINLEDKNQVAAVDLKEKKVTATWAVAPGESPAGLAIDPEKGRLFIGCHNQKLIVMDVKDGKVLADLPIGKGVDANAFGGGFAFASCGDGTLTIARESSNGAFEVVQTLNTARGARTMAPRPAHADDLSAHSRHGSRERPARPPAASRGFFQNRRRRKRREVITSRT